MAAQLETAPISGTKYRVGPAWITCPVLVQSTVREESVT